MTFNAQEFMGKLAETYGDPSAFSELVFGTPYHEGQKRFSQNATHDYNLLIPGNSWGKTEWIVRNATYEAWHKVGPQRPNDFLKWMGHQDNTLLASFEYDTIGEAYERFVHYYATREEVKALISGMTSSPTPVIRLANGARIDFGSLKDQGKHVEATRYNRIYVDEAGHIPDLSQTLQSVLYPRTMGVSGVIYLIGTPKPHSDPYLLEIFEKGKDGNDPFYYSHAGSVLENEYWPATEKARVLRNPQYVRGWRPVDHGEELGLLARAVTDIDGVPSVPVLTPMGTQVILGAFLLAGGYFFNRFHVARMFAWDGKEPERVGDSFAFPPQMGHVYMGAFDLAGNKRKVKKSRGSDPTVGFVLDCTERPWRVARFDYIPGGDADWEDKYQLMEQIYRDYNLPYLVIDATGQQDSVQEALQNRGIEVEGVQFGGTGNKKFDMLKNLALHLEWDWGGFRGSLRSPMIENLKYELDHYIIPDDDIKQDCVMALAMVVHEVALADVPASSAGEVW